jgi:surface antigen
MRNTSYIIRLFWLLVLAFAVNCFEPSLTSAYADTSLCSGDYSMCTSMGYTDHAYSSHSDNSYWGAISGHNCTNYVAYAETVVNGASNPGIDLGLAYQWWQNAQNKGYTADDTPGKGAVAWWDKAAWNFNNGHVAYVEKYDSNSITVSWDSYPNGPFEWRVISTDSSMWPSGFIHFKDLSALAYEPLVADWNGDGLDDIGLRKVSTGTFFLKPGPLYDSQEIYSGWASTSNFQPISGDFNGDGFGDIGLRKVSTGTFYFRMGPFYDSQASYVWASGTDFQPLTGDWNGDGIDDIGLRKISTGTFFLKPGPSFSAQITYSGWATGIDFEPFAADFNGDGLDDIGVRKISNGTFFMRLGPDYTSQISYGGWASTNNFQPFAGDFNGDGYGDIGLRKISTGIFFMRYGPGFSYQSSYAWAAG